MADLWAENSLRGRYLKLKKERLNNIPLKPNKKDGLLISIFDSITERVKNDGLRKKVDNFICPNCLKAIVYKELSFTCPFCDENYGDLKKQTNDLKDKMKDSDAELFDVIGKAMVLRTNDLKKETALFDKCAKCDGKIRYVECYHCHNPIDLFAPYDEEELEAKRYE